MNESVLAKIRKILAKAEGTDNEHEAQAFLNKAQELMAYHHVHASDLKEDNANEMVQVKVVVGKKRAVGNIDKVSLFCTLCDLNGCKGYRMPGRWDDELQCSVDYAAGVGRRSDMELVEELFTHLLMQIERDVQHAVKYEKPEWDSAKTYRSNFMQSWVRTVSNRLEEQHAKLETKIRVETSDSLSLVLADKRVMSERALKEQFGVRLVTSTRMSANYSASGRAAGSASGRRADLSGGRTKRVGGRGALNQ